MCGTLGVRAFVSMSDVGPSMSHLGIQGTCLLVKMPMTHAGCFKVSQRQVVISCGKWYQASL